MTFSKTMLALAALGLSSGVFANVTNHNTASTIYGNTFGTGSSYSTTFLGGVTATFTALTGDLDTNSLSAAKFSVKPEQGGIQGVGVSPLHGSERTPGEIDIGEYIKGTFSTGVVIHDFSVGLLFNGPEYADVNEKAKITVVFADSTRQTFTLTATGNTTAVWTGGGTVTNLSPAIEALGGAWDIKDPFGTKSVRSIYFGAQTGTCGTGPNRGACTNQSDYTFNSITAVTSVPEPETYALMLAGLGLVGAVARRRKMKQA